jgi:hypothetical protein
MLSNVDRTSAGLGDLSSGLKKGAAQFDRLESGIAGEENKLASQLRFEASAWGKNLSKESHYSSDSVVCKAALPKTQVPKARARNFKFSLIPKVRASDGSAPSFTAKDITDEDKSILAKFTDWLSGLLDKDDNLEMSSNIDSSKAEVSSTTSSSKKESSSWLSGLWDKDDNLEMSSNIGSSKAEVSPASSVTPNSSSSKNNSAFTLEKPDTVLDFSDFLIAICKLLGIKPLNAQS